MRPWHQSWQLLLCWVLLWASVSLFFSLSFVCNLFHQQKDLCWRWVWNAAKKFCLCFFSKANLTKYISFSFGRTKQKWSNTWRWTLWAAGKILDYTNRKRSQLNTVIFYRSMLRWHILPQSSRGPKVKNLIRDKKRQRIMWSTRM